MNNSNSNNNNNNYNSQASSGIANGDNKNHGTKVAQIGLFAATMLIVSNMLGSGVFMLPTVLAQFGGVSLIGWIVAMFGVLALAFTFMRLAQLIAVSAGPYSYVHSIFGDYLGFQTNYIYSLASWIGNVSMVSVILGYIASMFPAVMQPLYAITIQLAIIWLFTLLNIFGARVVSMIQGFSLSLALIPIVFTAIFGWHWFRYDVFIAAWNTSSYSNFKAVNLSFDNIMWAFIGIESACISSSLIKNPKRNVPLATILSVVIVTLLYIATCTVIMGVVPNKILISSNAPFATFIEQIFGKQAAHLIVICAIINCLGALAGWTMVIGQTAKGAAMDGLFPRLFAKLNKHNMPSYGLIIVAIVMSLVVLVTISPSASHQFANIITMSVILYLVSYVYCGFSLVRVCLFRQTTSNALYTNKFYACIGVLAAIFCLWAIVNTEFSYTVALAFMVVLLSVFFYALQQPNKSKLKSSSS